MLMRPIGYDTSRFRLFVRAITTIVLLLILPGGHLRTQQNILKFDRISIEQGLSDNYVLCMIQDSQGLIWFGTRDGLNRFDGYSVAVYRPDISNPGALSNGGVESMMEDREGRLWLGTRDGGLNRFDKTTGRFIYFEHDSSNPRSIIPGTITRLCEQDQYIWVVASSPQAGLCRVHKETGAATRYSHSSTNPGSISSDKVTSVTSDKFGTVWVGTEDAGLNRFDPVTEEFINHHHNPLYSVESTGSITRLYADAHGTLWFWPFNASPIRWLDLRKTGGKEPPAGKGGAGLRINSMTQARAGRIYALHHDRQGMLWLGGSNGGAGIRLYSGGELTYTNHNDYDPYSLGSDRIYCIMEDRSGNIWFGTDNGVSKFNRRNWHPRYYQHDPLEPNTLSRGVVRNILKDRQGNLWIATENGGVNRLAAATGVITRYAYNPADPTSINDRTTNVLYEDSRGDIWVGTNTGLARFNKKTGTFHRYLADPKDKEHLTHSGVWSILEDRKGTFWIGTFGGMCTLDRTTDRFTYYPTAGGSQGARGDRILSLFEDRKGDIWAGTNQGLSRRDATTGAWRHYAQDREDSSSLGNNHVWFTHEDRDGIIWLATSGGGLNRLDPRTGIFRHFTEREGLANNVACGILEDDRGRLWISTTRGISMFDRSTEKFRNYALQDGFYIYQFHFKSCLKDERGFFYFGGTNGVIIFHPDSISDNRHVPDIVLTSFKVFGRERILELGRANEPGIDLAYDSNFFSLGFAALDFTNSRRNSYRYRLEGLDDEWRDTDGHHPRADYTNIPPGNYTFRVQGSNSDGIWNEQGLSIAVHVTPAFWQTWWFRGLVILLAGASGVAVVGGHIRNIRRRGMLERKLVEYQLKALRAQMNPHFIFNSLNSILLFMLDHDIDAAHLYLTKFSRLMRSTLEHSKSEAVPLAEELNALRCYLELEALRLDNTFTYTIDMAPDIDIDEVMIPPMLIQPYAENAIKHGLKPVGPGGILSVGIYLDGEWIVCSVTDNGIGRKRAIDTGKRSHRSRGMEVTKNRLEVLSSLSRQHYGLEVIDLTGDEGLPLGTRVNIRIPISHHLHKT